MQTVRFCRIGLYLLLALPPSLMLEAQSASISSKLIAFPNQATGASSSPSNLTLSNNQSVALAISSIQTSLPFSQSNNCGTSLAAGQSCTLNITFSPSAVKYYSSSLVIAHSALNSPLTVVLTGSGIVPVTLSPTHISFPNQSTGSSSSPSSITLTNKQAVALNMSNIQVPLPFSQTNNCGSSLAAGQSCVLNITFSPTAVQYYSSSLIISDDATNSPQTIALTGNGVVPVTFSPTHISFPSQALGTSSSPSIVTIGNNQSVALNMSNIQIALPFSQSNNCGTSLAAGQSCTLTVSFNPTAVQYYSSSLIITDNSPNSPQTVALTGNGIAAIAFTPKVGGLYFSHQIVSTPSTPQPITITNGQSIPVTFSSMTSSADYPFTTNCGSGNGAGTLAAGATCTVLVSFNPQAIGSRIASLTIFNSAAGSPFTFPLQGIGVAGSPGPGVKIKPPLPCILPSETEQFNAIVTGLSNPSVLWYVDNRLNGDSTVGTLSLSGLYTAPPYVGSHFIKAVSQASALLSGSATISITQTPGFQIYPFVASIPAGGQQAFQAQTCSVPDSAVTFTVDNIPGGNGTVGTVSNSGLYTAPSVAGKHVVKATDSALNRSSGGVVTVFSSITADFASRTYTNYPIPANIFGTGLADSIHSVADRSLLTQAGMTDSRLYAQIPLVYATQIPDWSKIDPFISSIQAAGQHVMLQMAQSPAWLQPTSGACGGGNTYAAPTDLNLWTQIAVSYVAHMDSKFPGVVQNYEIWNEPNATGMCAGDHLNTYMAIYAAAAPAMKEQAIQDRTTIRVGGPALSGYTALWLSTLLTNPATAPYVDFVSYHQYIFGAANLQVQWDTYTGDVSLYEGTQDASNGVFANYNKVLAQTAVGNQPLGAQTPVYITEFNTNWAFYQDCCRNSPTYAPVWNSLYVTDLLNSVYNGSLKVPDKLIYFAGSQYPWFCLIGVQNSNMDCLYSVGATPVPYPQYYAFQLLASNAYLGLSGGGYMAKTLSTPTGGGGLATTAFYTSTQDTIVITNPTATAYSQISVTFANPGFASTQGTLYTIPGGAEIASSPISFSVQGTNSTATIAVPAYSVQAISLK